MKILSFLFCFLFILVVHAQDERTLILEIKIKDVMTAFSYKKDEATKTQAILEFIKSLKPLCLKVAKVKWNEIPASELKKMDKEVGVFIGGMSDYQIKLRADESAQLGQSDRSEIRYICRLIERHSLN